jgi:hypothetical protein
MPLLNSTLAQHFFNPGSGATLTHCLKTVAARSEAFLRYTNFTPIRGSLRQITRHDRRD